jgi:hypothetical protein
MSGQAVEQKVDPVELAIFRSAVHSVAEEMGAALRRTALSPNIKERRDYSCAVFDAEAQVIAMGDHMPVHLGSMPMSVEAAVAAVRFAPGDIAVLNDPYAGGNAFAGHHDGASSLPFRLREAAWVLMFRQSCASRGRGGIVCGLHGAGAGDLSGGHSNPSRSDCARGAVKIARCWT